MSRANQLVYTTLHTCHHELCEKQLPQSYSYISVADLYRDIVTQAEFVWLVDRFCI